MKKTSWKRYYAEQTKDPTTRELVEDELRSLRVGVQLAKARLGAGLTQTQLAAKVGMSAPNISRIESNPGQNLTLQTLVKLFRALDHEVEVTPRPRRKRARRSASARPR
jgi:transcriptional regulator with XRE-family HTH domain